MKTYIYKTIFLWLLMSSYLIHSQRPYNNRNRYRNFKVKKIRQKKGRGEYLRFYSLKYMKKPATEDVRDFNFDWGNNFDGAFRNLALMEQAQKAQLMEWYRRQFNLIKDEIGKHLNKSFNNYDQAKDALFSDIETKNINKNKPALISKYDKLYIPGRNKNRKYLKELKYIQLREVEIRAGNINNSQFPYLKAKGILLKNITSLSKLSEFRYDFENAFGNQISKNLEYLYTIEKLEYLGSSFDNEMLKRKHKYYDSFSKWDQLGLMQFLLNLEHIKRLMNCQVCLVPNELRKFMSSDMATENAIEEYAINNRNKSLSIFDPRYPQVHRFKYQNNFCGGPIDLMGWEADKKVALDKILDDVSTRRIIGWNLLWELKITYNSQMNWLLYSNESKKDVINLSNFMQEYRVNGIVPVEIKNFAKEAIRAFLNGAEVDYEERIINGLTGKAKCVYDKIKELNLFKSTIGKFAKGNYNLILKGWTQNACNNPSDDGCTDAKDLINGNITIYIQNIQQGTLDLAATILHEGIHAELYKYVDEYQKGIDPNNRKNLLEYYFAYKVDNGGNRFATSNAQHQHMADAYITPIAEALRQLDNYQYPIKDYLSLAWDGLRSYGIKDPSGVEGYFDNGKWTTLDSDKSYEGMNKILKNTNFNKDCK